MYSHGWLLYQVDTRHERIRNWSQDSDTLDYHLLGQMCGHSLPGVVFSSSKFDAITNFTHMYLPGTLSFLSQFPQIVHNMFTAFTISKRILPVSHFT